MMRLLLRRKTLISYTENISRSVKVIKLERFDHNRDILFRQSVIKLRCMSVKTR